MSVAIVGLGEYVPEAVRHNDYWAGAMRERPASASERVLNDIPPPLDERAAALIARDLELEAHDPMLGVRERRMAPDAVSAAQAEARAAEAALAEAGVRADQVDVILSASLVPDRLCPPTATQVAALLGARSATALGVDTVCSSALTQLQVARAYLESGLAKVVVITQSHLLLRVVPRLHPATPGLGDAATAMVLMRGEGPLRVREVVSHTDGTYSNAVTWVRGNDDETDIVWWKAGGEMRVGSRMPEGAKLLMRETVAFGALTVREVCRKAGVSVDRIDVLASVQPRGFIPRAIAEHLGLRRDQAVVSYEERAHVGACGPVVNLLKARAEGRLTPGAIVAMYAQGAGFTRAATLLEVSKSAST